MRSLLMLALTGAVILFPPVASKASGATTDACRGYRAAMLVAREALAHGERQAAIAALRKAKAALEACHREEARMASPLAAVGSSESRRADT